MLKIIRALLFYSLIAFVGQVYHVSTSNAQSLIRDTEIEDTIALFSKPIFDVAGVSSDSVEIYLVNDKRLNAFVAGGQKLFLHTGLLQRSETPEQLIGVIAHETGHIAGGHLSRLKQKLEGISPESILGYVLGGAAIAAGRGDIGSGLIFGGQQMAQRSLLSYTRTEEGAADQAAITYLNETGVSPAGLLEFFEILKEQQFTTTSEQNPYTRSHPLTLERIAFVRDQLAASPVANAKVPSDFVERHARIKAKLDGYFLPYQHVLRLYPEAEKSIAARYARAFAFNRNSQIDRALAEIDSLISERPNDPFFHEYRGEILFDNGRVVESIPSYSKANELRPGSSLLLRALGRAHLNAEQFEEAVQYLEESVRLDPNSSFSWRQLAIALGKLGLMAESSIALAEEALLQRKYDNAIFLAGRAEKDLPVGSRKWIQAQDIRLNAERLKKQKR